MHTSVHGAHDMHPPLVAKDGQTSSSAPLQMLWHAARPEVKLILLISIGVCLELSTPQGFGNGRKALALLVRNIFIPSLIISKLAPQIDITELYRCWLIPVVVFGNLFVGMLLGRATSPFVVKAKPIQQVQTRTSLRDRNNSLLKAKSSDDNFNSTFRQDQSLICPTERAKRRLQHIMTLATGIGNYGNLPIVIVSSLCDDSTGPIGSLYASSVECKSAGVAYAALGMACGQFTMWFFGYIYMLRVIAQEKRLTAQFNPGSSGNPTVSSAASKASLVDVCRTAMCSPPILSSRTRRAVCWWKWWRRCLVASSLLSQRCWAAISHQRTSGSGTWVARLRCP
eukprot:m.148370 g.148370  ORF g.148370 m.148370 type:complete len:340 (+) comp17801_c0_seq7:267-1286(+)